MTLKVDESPVLSKVIAVLILGAKIVILFQTDDDNAAAAKSLQSCPTLSDPKDCSPPGSSVHGIFQARALEWGTIAFSG